MAEGTYEYECNRAELLGIDPPNRVDWEEAERVRRENKQAEELTEIDIQNERTNEGTSKMDEITNILSITQMRLNKFKKACGSLTNLLKIKGGDGAEGSDATGDEGESNAETSSQSANVASDGSAPTPAQPDLQQKMSSGMDKLDALLTKTENAQYSMGHQTKQMKSFLK
ncbi:uncharacterized protein LOC129580273 [Sitodiplosis mosellana]|uniref:uncharacterized protein LOC129580273 n=1 Tax=Sitodiplosis mosellana TaxID=263140 RepID=UPI002444349F|nr:uncharacterized protein LOC129580273 [Sitodiplosis mosellana]XP_055326515.1 uncharacterized protein LOC129580273 [Sitodiplosis mosellana]